MRKFRPVPPSLHFSAIRFTFPAGFCIINMRKNCRRAPPRPPFAGRGGKCPLFINFTGLS